MLDQLANHLDIVAQQRVKRTIAALSTTPLPPGVSAEAHLEGVILTGRNLRHRVITDPLLRNFGR
jgi:hypothetical protein